MTPIDQLKPCPPVTEEMIEAGDLAAAADAPGQLSGDCLAAIYLAMHEARPTDQDRPALTKWTKGGAEPNEVEVLFGPMKGRWVKAEQPKGGDPHAN